jgi:hypothetical protein
VKPSLQKSEEALRTVAFLIVLVFATLVSICDVSILWAAVPFRWFAGISLLILATFNPRHVWRIKLGLFVLFAGWLGIMPFLPWTKETQFFLKGGLIYRGMAGETVKRWMQGYYVEAGEHRLSFAPQFPSADWVTVDLEDGRVCRVGMSPD